MSQFLVVTHLTININSIKKVKDLGLTVASRIFLDNLLPSFSIYFLILKA